MSLSYMQYIFKYIVNLIIFCFLKKKKLIFKVLDFFLNDRVLKYYIGLKNLTFENL